MSSTVCMEKRRGPKLEPQRTPMFGGLAAREEQQKGLKKNSHEERREPGKSTVREAWRGRHFKGRQWSNIQRYWGVRLYEDTGLITGFFNILADQGMLGMKVPLG